MTEIVNLRRMRKRLAREMDARRAEENRALFGRSKGDRRKSEAENTRLTRDLDGARLEAAEPAGDTSMKSDTSLTEDT